MQTIKTWRRLKKRSGVLISTLIPNLTESTTIFYNLTSFDATNPGKFRLNMNVSISFLEPIKDRNKQAAGEKQYVSTLHMNPGIHTTVVRKQLITFLQRR